MRHALLAAVAAVLAGAALVASGPAGGATEWAVNATAIEACNCPVVCACYFNHRPAGHAAHDGHGAKHFCRANIAYKVNKGYHGATRLDGAKFWIAADLGDDFSDGETEWAVLYFDRALSAAQREAISVVTRRLFPVKWKSFETAEGLIDTWRLDKDGARASLDGGRTAEVRLRRHPGMTDEPVVIRNLKYWGAPRNDGLLVMSNEVQAYRAGQKAFEFKGTSGFVITVDMTSKDFGS